MAKGTSGHSSVAGSTRASSPHENGLEVPAQDSHSMTADPSNPPDADMTVAHAAESQPIKALESNSSNPVTNDDAGGSAGGAATAYGTRSRNRTGASRPNYAEDKEADVEFDAAPSSKESRKAARAAAESVPTTIPDGGRIVNAARQNPGLESEQIPGLPTHPKEPIPGTSTFSANPAPAGQSSRKRKANGQSAGGALPPQQAQVPPHGTIATSASRGPSAATQGIPRETNMLSFDDCKSRLKDKVLVADDGTVLEVNDHVYLVCEPPGEPYYLGRIMEFLHVNNDSAQPIDALRLNWYYRPKDIGRKVNDARQVFASMHSDISPLTALRGKCDIKHKSEVEKMDTLRKTSDSFWYEKLYDRYIHRFYDVISTGQVINVPAEVKKVLDERWRYIVVEPSRGKELTSAVKSCKRCSKYCASNDSVDCAVCQSTYHMSCVNPPLLKKPSRGFAWACGPCSKAQEKKLEARNTPNINDTIIDGGDEEVIDEEDGRSGTLGDSLDTGQTTPTQSSEGELSIHPGTAEQIHQASLWLFRYLGIHCKVEDALDYDDRIYPRASSRLGPRHQAHVTPWPGRPVEYVKPADVKRKYVKGGGHKKDSKLVKETLAAIEADKVARENRPKWVQDEPPGYIYRGEDRDKSDPRWTSELLFKLPDVGESSDFPERGTEDSGSDHLSLTTREQLITDYMERAKKMAKPLGLPLLSTNLLDVAVDMLRLSNYDPDKALEMLSSADKKLFKEPDLSSAETKKFEDGVVKYGSEWYNLKKHVKSVSAANIVRFYYTWKKTDRGKQIWGNYSGRKGKKEAKKAEANAGKLQDDVADEHDDSAFDNDKAFEKKRGFQCKFCATRSSQQWRRAPNTPAGMMIPETFNGKVSGKDKGAQLMVALCRRCAYLWRRYAIQYDDDESIAKQATQGGVRAGKRKIDEELLKELELAAKDVPPLAAISATGTPAPAVSTGAMGPEPPRKKLKGIVEKDPNDSGLESGGLVTAVQQKKKAAVEKPAPLPPPPPPEPPKAKLLPCAICSQVEPLGDQHLTCKDCRMAVHRNCYGVVGETRSPNKWICDMCSNDKNPQVSIQYKCMLCPVDYTEQDFVEPPKVSHKKKTEKDRERDRIERENALKVADYFRKKQEELNKPLNPREPLKRTANNNWVHVTCAVFTPEVKFGSAKALEPSEGIPSIPPARYDEICKACKRTGGACVYCHCCKASVHVECAHQAGYILGFDITPVKGSRRDQTALVNINGESGTMTAAIWCKEHLPKTIVHQMFETVDENGLNALQLFAQKFKQADLALTGTVRKANLVNQSTKVPNLPTSALPSTRKASTAVTTNGAFSSGRGSVSHVKLEDSASDSTSTLEKRCITCSADVSPKWWPCSSTAHNSVSFGHPLLANGDIPHLDVSSITNGVPVQGAAADKVGGTTVALATAALHRNTQQPLQASLITDFQCHKCHWKKLQKEPTLSPTPPVEEEPRPPLPTPAAANSSAPEPDVPRPVTQYAWPPPPPSYPPTPSTFNWPRPAHPSQSIGTAIQYNGGHSPHASNGQVPPINGQPQMRPHVQSITPSPRENGHVGHNGYPQPPSPRHSLGSTPHIANGGYPSYTTSRTSPQQLTNGGPLPRAPEYPLQQHNAPMQARPSFGSVHGSPPTNRDTYPHGRDSNSIPNDNVRASDGRVNGGASASPSLRNLLS